MRRRDSNSIAWRDILISINLMVSVSLGIVLFSINPPAASGDPANQPGNMSVSIAWPEGPTDVDLWVLAPGDAKAVGYSRRSGSTFNLLRDDLGTTSDTMPFNREDAYSRGLPDGEYVINLHAYRAHIYPVSVSVEVRVGAFGGDARLILEERVDLVSQGQELTVARFHVKDGAVVWGTMNRVFLGIRGAK